jgi:hypothetical protein
VVLVTEQTPQEGIAHALGDLSEQTRSLVRQEIDAAERELWEKALAAAPAVALGGIAAGCALLAAASAYRWSLRLLERAVSPPAAALLATVGYGAAAGVAGAAAYRRFRAAPAPLPTETAAHTVSLLHDTAAQAEARVR